MKEDLEVRKPTVLHLHYECFSKKVYVCSMCVFICEYNHIHMQRGHPNVPQ
jgi:hypothetical protein